MNIKGTAAGKVEQSTEGGFVIIYGWRPPAIMAFSRLVEIFGGKEHVHTAPPNSLRSV